MTAQDSELPLRVQASSLTARDVASIRAETASHRTLADVVRWGLAVSPQRLVTNVIKQDEFTQDVVVPYLGELFLVYDTS